MAPPMVLFALLALSGAQNSQPLRAQLQIDPVPGFIAPCDFAAQIPMALKRTFPGLGFGQAGGLKILIRLWPDQLELELRLADAALERKIAQPYTACEATADGVALIIERYLSDLGFEPSPASLPALPPNNPKDPKDPKVKTATTTQPKPEVAPIATATTATTATKPSSWPLSLSIGLGGRGQAPANAPVQPGGGLRLKLGLGPLEFGIDSAFMNFEEAKILRGGAEVAQIRVFSIQLLASVGWCFGFGDWSACLLARGGVERTQAAITADDGIHQLDRFSGNRVVYSPLALAELRLDWQMVSWLSLYISGAGAFRPRPLEYNIEDAEGAYKLPPASGLLEIGVWFQIFEERENQR